MKPIADLWGRVRIQHLRLGRGYIGFPGPGHRYRLRKLALDPLPSKQKYVDLFDGSLARWTLRGSADFDKSRGFDPTGGIYSIERSRVWVDSGTSSEVGLDGQPVAGSIELRDPRVREL